MACGVLAAAVGRIQCNVRLPPALYRLPVSLSSTKARQSFAAATAAEVIVEASAVKRQTPPTYYAGVCTDVVNS